MGGGPGGAGGGVNSQSILWAAIMSAFAGTVFSLLQPSSSSHSPTAFGGILFGYDTGTIGGIIAMEDWLKNFGSFDSSIGYYLPTNNSSLVVRIYLSFSDGFSPASRSRFSQLERSSALCLHTPWEISSAESGVSSLPVSSFLLVSDYSWTPSGQRLSLGVVS